jgi:hypothetical protein
LSSLNYLDEEVLTSPRYVQIGCLAGLELTLPGAILRAKNITLRGSGPGAWSMAESKEEIPKLLETLATIKPFPVKAVPLSDIEGAWDAKEDKRVVFTMN